MVGFLQATDLNLSAKYISYSQALENVPSKKLFENGYTGNH